MIDAYGWFVGGNPKIEGETQDTEAAKKKGFDVIDFSFGIENQVNVGSATGGLASGRATLERMVINKNTDTATTNLVLASCTGAHIPEFHLSIRKGGVDAKKSGGEYIHVTLNHVLVESVKWAGADGDEAFKDEVTLAYAGIKIHYKKQATAGGALSDGGTVQWNQTKNEAVLA